MIPVGSRGLTSDFLFILEVKFDFLKQSNQNGFPRRDEIEA